MSDLKKILREVSDMVQPFVDVGLTSFEKGTNFQFGFTFQKKLADLTFGGVEEFQEIKRRLYLCFISEVVSFNKHLIKRYMFSMSFPGTSSFDQVL